MGVELAIGTLWIRRNRDPDWAAAHRAVRAVDLATIWGTGDDHFPLESWFDQVPDPPDPAGVYVGLRAAQAHLEEAIDEVRSAVERGMHFVRVVNLPAHVVYVTGGLTGGDPPPDPFPAIVDFAEAGLARSAGFEGWTRYCAVDLEERTLDFSGDEQRSVAATRALMFIEDLALDGPFGGRGLHE